MTNRSKKKIRIILYSYSILFFFIICEILGYEIKKIEGTFSKEFIIFFSISTLILHMFVAKSLLNYIRFKHIEEVIIKKRKTFQEFTIKEIITNHLLSIPITFSISLGINYVDHLITKGFITIVLFSLIVLGITSMYRFKLYKSYFDQYIER